MDEKIKDSYISTQSEAMIALNRQVDRINYMADSFYSIGQGGTAERLGTIANSIEINLKVLEDAHTQAFMEHMSTLNQGPINTVNAALAGMTIAIEEDRVYQETVEGKE